MKNYLTDVFGFWFMVTPIVAFVTCNSAPVASNNELASNNSAPVVEATAEVNAALVQKITKLETKFGELEAQIGGTRAGGDIWNISTGGAGMAGMLLLYVLADRLPVTRKIKDALKGKTCPKN